MISWWFSSIVASKIDINSSIPVVGLQIMRLFETGGFIDEHSDRQ
jgi:hypothetical protein